MFYFKEYVAINVMINVDIAVTIAFTGSMPITVRGSE